MLNMYREKHTNCKEVCVSLKCLPQLCAFYFHMKLRWSKEKNICDLIIAYFLTRMRRIMSRRRTLWLNDYCSFKTGTKLVSFWFGIINDEVNRTITKSLSKTAEKMLLHNFTGKRSRPTYKSWSRYTFIFFFESAIRIKRWTLQNRRIKRYQTSPLNCWRAIARQHTILYNRAKFVGCKIGDMRSRFRFWYPGFLWSGTVRVIRDSCELLDKNAPIRSKLPTAACWFREITEENLKQTCFMSKAKATSVPQLGNHSQYSSHVGALNLIDESKSLPVEAKNSTIKLHLPVATKEKIVMIVESNSLPVEANNSTIELHLPVEAKEKLSEYIESKSLPVEVKEYFAILNSKYGSLAEASTHFHVEITS